MALRNRGPRIMQKTSWHGWNGDLNLSVAASGNVIQVAAIAVADVRDLYEQECTVRGILYHYWLTSGTGPVSGSVSWAVLDSEHPGTALLGALDPRPAGEGALGDERLMHVTPFFIGGSGVVGTMVQPVVGHPVQVRAQRKMREGEELRMILAASADCSIRLHARMLIGHGMTRR